MYLRSQSIIFLLGQFFLLPVDGIRAQTPPEDSLNFARTLHNAEAIYYRSAGDQSRLYNGTQYVGYPFRFAEGSPFFLSDKIQPGSVVYDQVSFQGVNLQFDELRGVVIFQDESRRMQLSSDRISRFTIGDYSFIRIFHDSLGSGSPETSFYQVLYDGKLRVLKKEIKTIRETNSFGQEIIHVIDTKTNYYIWHNNRYTQINSQNELLDLFSKKKKEVLHFIKKNKLSFKKDTDNLLIQVAAYYEQQ